MQTGVGGPACLYLGPDGRRCERPAAEGGFCKRHDPERESKPLVSLGRIFAALLLVAALLWPLIADVLREIGVPLR
jgi:Family of unknown function (DUF5763)